MSWPAAVTTTPHPPGPCHHGKCCSAAREALKREISMTKTEIQETFDRGVLGTIAQGFVYHSKYQGHSGLPGACFFGHQPNPVRAMRLAFGTCLENAARLNDECIDLATFRKRFSELALEAGLDDSCCWWEV